MVDLLSGETFDAGDASSVDVDIPRGMFRFLDIELMKSFEAR